MSVTIKWRKLPDIISSMTMEEYVKRKKKKTKQNSKRKRMGYNRSMMLLVDNNRVWLPTKNKQLSPSHGPNVAQLFGLAFFFSCDFFLLVNLKRTQTHFE